MGKTRGQKGRKRAVKTMKRKADEALKEDLLPDDQTAVETPQVIDMEDDELFKDRKLMWLPWDQKAEQDLAANGVKPYNYSRSKENLVVEFPNAFDEYKPKPYKEIEYDEEELEGLNDDERMKFISYNREYFQSEGFDIEHFCNKAIGSLLRLKLDEHPPGSSLCQLKPTIENAIKYFNATKNRKLVLDKIIKCNYIWTGILYYATFGVIDQDTGEPLTYQAKLIRDHDTGKTEIHKFRLKPGSPPQLKSDA